MELTCMKDFRCGVTAIYCPTKEDARVLIEILGACGIGASQLIDNMYCYNYGATVSVRCERNEVRIATTDGQGIETGMLSMAIRRTLWISKMLWCAIYRLAALPILYKTAL